MAWPLSTSHDSCLRPCPVDHSSCLARVGDWGWEMMGVVRVGVGEGIDIRFWLLASACASSSIAISHIIHAPSGAPPCLVSLVDSCPVLPQDPPPTRPLTIRSNGPNPSIGTTLRCCRSPLLQSFNTSFPFMDVNVPCTMLTAVHSTDRVRDTTLIASSTLYKHPQSRVLFRHARCDKDAIRLHRPNHIMRSPSQGGETMVLASHETSSKLCSTLKPIAERLSKWPSPSI